MDQAQRNIEFIQSMYGAFARGEVSAIMNALTDDVEWGCATAVTNVPWMRMFHGKVDTARFFEIIAAENQISKFNPHSFTSSATNVACLVDVAETIKRAGVAIESTESHHFTIRDDKVSAFRLVCDTAAFAAIYQKSL